MLSQYTYRKEADINLPNSNELAISITAVDAPANKRDNPVTEKYAAAAAIQKADNPNKKVLNFILLYQANLRCCLTYCEPL